MSPDDDPLRAAREMFGGNLRAVREHRGMGQRELAARMAERHFPWHQNTVNRAEKGARGVSYHEAEALAAILGVTADRFSWATPEAAAIRDMSAAAGRLQEAWREVADGAARLKGARDAAEQSAAANRDSKYDRVRDTARGLGDQLKGATLEAALGEAEVLWQRIKRGET